MRNLISSMTLLLVMLAASGYCVPAFPGAEGSGAATTGGRGGKIIEVTNLDDAGTGSFRAAVTASGARIVVFRVGGIISLKSRIFIGQGNLTIAGQTAPGGGIILRGSDLPNGQTDIIYVEATDIVIRYIRFRYGYSPNLPVGSQVGHNLFIANKCKNIILDHCSFSWAADENITMWSTSTGYSNITVQRCISSEGFKGHGCGAIIGGGSDVSSLITDVDVHHNLFLHNQNRNPLFKGRNARIINNIVYDWDWWPTGWEAGCTIDIIGNSYKKGPASGSEREIYYRTNTDYGVNGSPSIFVAGNKGPTNPNPDADNWNMIDANLNWVATKTSPNTSLRRTATQPSPANQITVHSSEKLDSLLLDDAGACKRLDQNGTYVSNRDAVDTRVIEEYRNGTGVIPANESEVGGFPTLAAGTAYPDADHDGMADAWEQTNGLNPNSSADQNLDADSDGYANVEEFLNGTNPKNGSVNTVHGGIPARVAHRGSLARVILQQHQKITVSIKSSSDTRHSLNGRAIGGELLR